MARMSPRSCFSTGCFTSRIVSEGERGAGLAGHKLPADQGPVTLPPDLTAAESGPHKVDLVQLEAACQQNAAWTQYSKQIVRRGHDRLRTDVGHRQIHGPVGHGIHRPY